MDSISSSQASNNFCWSYIEMDLTDLDYKIIDEYENYDKFFVKVFGQGEAFWCYFICYDLDDDAFVLQVDQLLCREHPFKYGERIIASADCCELEM
ncbi:unnamed protein product [Phytophthora lilii]|uniref:Unnamed protein product n=1 Tax=Phytophthora lilii TaxID=2077276 RepID=A0A9W6X7V4_9STRA|nr:unnamed protein product [Phytophthora lilii]